MKRILYWITVLLIFIYFLSSEENNVEYIDDLSRLELLGFNYFPEPFSLPEMKVNDGNGNVFTITPSADRIFLLIFIQRYDPFHSFIHGKVKEIRTDFKNRPLDIIIVNEERNPASRQLGMTKYPGYFLIDHRNRLRGSAEGIYPDLGRDDFYRVLEKLLLDIQTPSVIDTLQ